MTSQLAVVCLMVPTVLLAQVVINKPSERFNIGLTYINSYNADDTGTGSGRHFARFDDEFFDEIGYQRWMPNG